MSWVFVLSALLVGGGEIEWQKGDLPKAFETARETGEPIMVYFRADWDRFSGQLDDGAFSDKDVVSLSKKFIRVLIDCSKKPVYREMTRLHQLEGLPSLFFYDASGRKMGSVVGYVPDQDAYLLAMQEAIAKKNLLPQQDWKERIERIQKRVEETLSTSLARVRVEIDKMVRRSLGRLKRDRGEQDDTLDRDVDLFAGKIREKDDLHIRLKVFLRSGKGKRFIRGQMNMLGVDRLEDAVEHYFQKNGDGSYSVRTEYEAQLRGFLDQMVPPKKSGGVTLGFSGGDLSEEDRDALSIKPGKGIRISKVVLGGPAEKAGIKAGDILVFMGGREVGPGTIREVIATLSPGKAVSVVILRDGKRKRLSLVPLEKGK
ncbi:MAG: PDZ domain-containing protein [Planctomycetota bacterium]|jgi:hypothetical protein|nr:PDZ domain-containing protein [Planctomycetota bacterium]